ncbi:CU044_2847 family protein [Streptomyces sp. NPDC059247]|uniref:CU044_2847 family protein n=1 Tax=Streptomyces sp. NPDC059247 TaxID=3346790 RepID=UPI00369010E1
MTDGIARVRLDDGTPVWARVRDVQELGRGGGFQDTGVRDRVVSMTGGLTDVVRGVVGSLRAGLEPRGPVEVAVSFGIELSAQSGKVIGVLADGSGTASVNVSLTWTEPGRTTDLPAPDAGALPPGAPSAEAPGAGALAPVPPPVPVPPAPVPPPAAVSVPPAPHIPPARAAVVPPAPTVPPTPAAPPAEAPPAPPAGSGAPERTPEGGPTEDGTA